MYIARARVMLLLHSASGATFHKLSEFGTLFAIALMREVNVY